MRRATEHSTPKPASYFEAYNDHVVDAVPQDAQRILEVGCASGRLGEGLKKRRPDVVIHGLERDAGAAEQARKRIDRVFETDLDEPLPPLDGPYDCVVCADILEHLVDPWTVLRRLVGQLVSGGHVVASIPNVRYYKVLRDLLWKGRFTYREAGVLDSTHLRFFTYPEIERLYDGAGLDVVHVRPRLHGGNALIRGVDRILAGRLVHLRAVQYTVVGRLRP